MMLQIGTFLFTNEEEEEEADRVNAKERTNMKGKATVSIRRFCI